MLPDKTSWLSESFPNKFEKRWEEVLRCEQLREVVRETDFNKRNAMLKRNSPQIPEAAQQPAVKYYYMHLHDGAEKSSKNLPYYRNLVYIQLEDLKAVCYSSSWVRTLYDKQWWIVAERATPNSVHGNLSHLYLFFLMFIPQANVTASDQTIAPSPKIWITLDHHNKYPMEMTVYKPTTVERKFPSLQVTCIKEEKRSAFVKRNWRICTRINAKDCEADIVQYQCIDNWPIENDGSTSGNMRFKKPKMRNALRFLRAVDLEHRSHPKAPIVVERSGVPKKFTECAGPFMAALSVLRTCNFKNLNQYKSPNISGSAGKQRRKLEVMYHTRSPLQFKFDYGSGTSDKVLQEVKKLLDQRAFIMGDMDTARYALWMTYSLVALESDVNAGMLEHLDITSPSSASDRLQKKPERPSQHTPIGQAANLSKTGQPGQSGSALDTSRRQSPAFSQHSTRHVANYNNMTSDVRRTVQPGRSGCDYPPASAENVSSPSSRTGNSKSTRQPVGMGSSEMPQRLVKTMRHNEPTREGIVRVRTVGISDPKSHKAEVVSSSTSTKQLKGGESIPRPVLRPIDAKARSPLHKT